MTETSPVPISEAGDGICINCLDCVSACPQKLLPHYLYHFALENVNDQLETYRLQDCTNCGECSRVCPSNLPLSLLLTEKKKSLQEAATKIQEAP